MFSNRKEFVDHFEKKYKKNIEDNCHFSIKENIELMEEFLKFHNLKDKLYWIQIITSDFTKVQTVQSPGDANIWRKYKDDDTQEYEEKNYTGHSCPGIIEGDDIYIFDPILLPWNIAIRGLEIEKYLVLTAKPKTRTCAVVDIYELKADDISENRTLKKSIFINLKQKQEYKQYDDGQKLLVPFTHEWFNYYY